MTNYDYSLLRNAFIPSFPGAGGWTRPSIKQYQGTTTLCGAGVDVNWYDAQLGLFCGPLSAAQRAYLLCALSCRYPDGMNFTRPAFPHHVNRTVVA